MSDVMASAVLANGLRTEFVNTYSKIQNRQKDSRLASVMDGLGATNREHKFAYFESAPYFEEWRRGDTIPTEGFDSVQFDVAVHSWGKRVKWHKHDRKDDQTASLMSVARQAGTSAGILEEEFFFDLLAGTTNRLPAVPLAPDGVALYSTVDGNGDARFGATSGNLLTGSGVGTASAIKTDVYTAIEQFKAFRDTKNQPLFSEGIVDGGLLLIHAAENTEIMEETFLQRRLGEVRGTDAGTTPTNLFQDASRNFRLWGSSRLTGNDYYLVLLNAPLKPTFLLDREGVQEFEALEGSNNSDFVRDTGQEYVQWERRAGAGIALPYATIKINN